jgi:uridine phosphorylase
MGIDNLGLFYQLEENDQTTQELLENIVHSVDIPKKVHPYITPSDKELTNRFAGEQVYKGITVTSSGFYGPQGRQLRLPLQTERMIESFEEFTYQDFRFTNLEMECSALFALSKSLGHRATAICLGLANRRRKEFSKNYETRIRELIVYVLDRI